MKTLIFFIFTILSIIIATTAYFGLGLIKLDPSRYRHLYSDKKLTCRITSKFSLDQENCYQAAINSLLRMESGYADDVFEYLCANGHMKSCITRDWFNFAYFSNAFVPPKTDIKSLINNCFNLNYLYYEKFYFCGKLDEVAKSLNDYDTITSIKLMKANNNFSKIYVSEEDFFIANKALTDLYFESRCNNDHTNKCNSLFELNLIKSLMHESLVKKDKYLILKREVSRICKTKKNECHLILNNSNFLALAYTYRDFNFFKTLPLSYEASIFIIQSMNTAFNDEWIYTVNSPYLRNLLFNAYDSYEAIFKSCKENSDKRGCFLAFKDIHSAKENIPTLKEFCSGGDESSCTILKIFDSNLDQYVDKNYDLRGGIIEYKETLIAEEFTRSFRFRVASFISSKRNQIIVLLTFINLLFQLYIIHLYLKSNDIFKYIRSKTIQEIRSKLNK